MHVASDFTLYRRLLRQARPFWPHLAVLFALSLLATPVALLAPLPLKLVVDSVLGSRPLPHLLGDWFPAAARSPTAGLALAIGLLITVALLSQLLAIATNWLRAYVGEYLVLQFRARLLEQGQRLSLSYHDSRGTVDTAYRIQQDATTLQYVAVDGFIPFVAAGISLVAMLVVTAQLDWQLALVALAISPFLFLLSRRYRPRMRRQGRVVKKLESQAMSVVQEILSALRVVKAFGQERRETERFATRAREGVVARLRLALMEGGFGLMIGLTSALGTGAVLFIGVGRPRACKIISPPPSAASHCSTNCPMSPKRPMPGHSPAPAA